MGKESVQLSILFTGANGQVGKALKLILKDVKFDALTRDDLDLTNLELIFDILNKYNPSTIIHLAAYTCLLYTSPSPRDVEEWGIAGWGW